MFRGFPVRLFFFILQLPYNHQLGLCQRWSPSYNASEKAICKKKIVSYDNVLKYIRIYIPTIIHICIIISLYAEKYSLRCFYYFFLFFFYYNVIIGRSNLTETRPLHRCLVVIIIILHIYVYIIFNSTCVSIYLHSFSIRNTTSLP